MVTGLNSREPLTVLYDADCGICTHVARALVRLDQVGQLHLLPLQSTDIDGAPPMEELSASLHAVDGAGTWFRGAHATVEIARRVPVLWPISAVARLPGAMVILEIGYRLVAGNRLLLSRALGLKACRVIQSP